MSLLVAISGAGKTTLCQRLLRDFPQLTLSISCTTRAPRGNEKNGREYHFLTRPEFERRIQAEEFAEWANVHGNYYGTLKSTILEAWDRGRSVLLDIDVQGAASLRAAFPDRIFSVFISPPNLDTLEARLRARGTDSEEVIARRMANARKELDAAPEFHHVLVNDDLERAYQELAHLIRSALNRPLPEPGALDV
jgi:guanylate kinase